MNPVLLRDPPVMLGADDGDQQCSVKYVYLRWIDECHTVLSDIGNYTTAALQKIHSAAPGGSLSHAEIADIRACYSKWFEYTVLYAPWVEELRTLKFPGPTAWDKPRRVVENVQFHVFFELSRMWYCIHYGRLMEEQRRLVTTAASAAAGVPPDICFSLAHTVERDIWLRAEWSTLPAEQKALPFLSYTQRQVKAAMLVITENLAEYASLVVIVSPMTNNSV